jgi:hypothetical protein
MYDLYFSTMACHAYLDLQNNCHNPTNNPKQLKTTFVGVVLLLVRKTTTTTPPHHHTTTTLSLQFKSLQDNLGSLSSLCSNILIKLNGRRPHFFSKLKTTSILFFNGIRPLLFKLEDNLIFPLQNQR